MTVVHSTATGSSGADKRVADCGATNHAIAGGGRTTGNKLTGSYPSDSAGNVVATATTNPRYWTATFDGTNGSNAAYAICVPN